MSPTRSIAGVCAVAALLLSHAALAQPLGAFLDLGARSSSPSGEAVFASPEDGARFASGASFASEERLSIPSLRYIGEKFRIEASYRPSSFFGSAKLPGTARSAPVSLFTTLEVDHVSLGARANVLRRPTFSLGLGADFDRLRVSSTTSAFSAGLVERSVDRTLETPVATLGFNLHDRARRTFFDLKLGYSNLFGAELAKVRAEAGWSFAKYAGVKAGWEGMRFEDRRSSSGPRTDLKLGTLSGGFFFSF